MTNKQISRYLKEFYSVRKDWVDLLTINRGRSDAPVHIMDINAKIDLLRTLWDWSDESVDFPYDTL